jgi:hypothetical protein
VGFGQPATNGCARVARLIPFLKWPLPVSVKGIELVRSGVFRTEDTEGTEDTEELLGRTVGRIRYLVSPFVVDRLGNRHMEC